MAKTGHQVLTAFLLLAATNLYAGLEDAKTLYLRGLSFELKKDYVDALEAYKSSLTEYPAYIYAHRELANCYYYLGDRNNAEKECAAYLAVKPHDEQVRAFSERLEKGGAVWQQLPGLDPSLLGTPYQRTLYMGLTFGEVTTDNADVQQLSPGSSFLGQSASMGSIRIGGLSDSGFWLEGAFSDGPSRQYNVAGGSTSPGFSLNLNELTLSLEPGFRFPMGRNVSLGGGVALGYSWDSLAYSSDGSAVQNYSGSGFSYSPEIKLSLIVGKFGLDIGMGYHNSQVSPLKDDGGYPLTVADLESGVPENWTMDNSGYFLSFGIQYYARAPMIDTPGQPW